MDSVEEEVINGETIHTEDFKISAPIESASTGEDSVEIAESIGSAPGAVKANGDGNEAEDTADSLPKPTGSPDAASSSNPTPKGTGLKKWRRIRRDLSKDASSGAEAAQILKRRLSLPEPVKVRGGESNKQKSDAEGEGSVASNSAIASGAARGLGPELELLVACAGFSVGAESDSGEDRNSKSSTAGSILRMRHEAVGARERSRGKGFGARGSGHAVQQRGQRGRGSEGGLDASKTFRGDQLRSEKENSQSRIESDLRNSNVAFVRWGSNGKPSERSINDDGEHDHEAHTCEEVWSDYYKENGRIGDTSRDNFDADLQQEENTRKSKNSQSRMDLDPLIEAIVLLQAAQEALETEIQKFGEMRRDPILGNSSGQLEETKWSTSPSREAHFLELDKKIKHLEYRLEEASATIKAKESKVIKLESILDRIHSPMEHGLEGLVRESIEAEVEHLITSRVTQSWRAQSEGQIGLVEEQKSFVQGHSEMTLKLKDADNKAVKLKEHAEELEARRKELSGNEEVLKLRSKVRRSSLCCSIQLVMLCITLWWFLMQLLPLSDGIVPT